jgi:hypothetical protein
MTPQDKPESEKVSDRLRRYALNVREPGVGIAFEEAAGYLDALRAELESLKRARDWEAEKHLHWHNVAIDLQAKVEGLGVECDRLRSEYAALRERWERRFINEENLTSQLRAKVEELEKRCKTLDAVIKDDCHTEELVKELSQCVLGKEFCDGDSHGVPNSADMMDEMVKRYEELEKRNVVMREAFKTVVEFKHSATGGFPTRMVEEALATTPVKGWVKVGELEKSVKYLRSLMMPGTASSCCIDATDELIRLRALIDANK